MLTWKAKTVIAPVWLMLESIVIFVTIFTVDTLIFVITVVIINIIIITDIACNIVFIITAVCSCQ